MEYVRPNYPYLQKTRMYKESKANQWNKLITFHVESAHKFSLFI